MRQLQQTKLRFWFLGIGLIVCVSIVHARSLRKLETHRKAKSKTIHDSMVVQAGLKQSVDNFSDDTKAMSPRSWGEFHDGDSPQQLPPVSFDDSPVRDQSGLQPGAPEKYLRQVESSRVREPESFFRTEPIDPDLPASETNSSELPANFEDLYTQAEQELRQLKQENDEIKKELEQKEEQLDQVQRQEKSVVESQAEPLSLLGSNGDELETINQIQPMQLPDSMVSEVAEPFICDSCAELQEMKSGFSSTNYANGAIQDDLRSKSGKKNHSKLSNRIGKMFAPAGSKSECGCKSGSCAEETSCCGNEANYGFQPDCGQGCCCHNCDDLEPKFNEMLGHRSLSPTIRGDLSSSTNSFSFENDEEFPPIRELLAQSVFFTELEFMFLQPSFTTNSAFSASAGTNTAVTPFNFDLQPAFRVTGGFESDYGPGFAGEYFQFDNDSDLIDFTSDGVNAGQVEVNFLGGTSIATSLVADDLGESLSTSHSLELHSTAFYAFKAIVFKRAYVNGRFGLQFVSIEQVLESELFGAGGTSAGTLTQLSNFDGFGPRFGIDYVRRIGHTPAQLVASATGAILFGDRDQIIENNVGNELVNLEGDEFITNLDIFFGVQGKRSRGEKRNTTFRVGFVNQSWLGGGTAQDPSGDLAFQGISLSLGFNR